MQLNKKQFATGKHLLRAIISLCQQATDSGKLAQVIVSSNDDAQALKRIIAHHVQAGVNVCAYDHWLGECWDEYGDGSRLISSMQRKLLLSPLLADIIGRVPSNTYIEYFADFISEAIGELNHTSAAFSELELNIMDSVSEYKKVLDELSYVEKVQVENALPQAAFDKSVLIFVDLNVCSTHMQRALEHFGECTLSYDLRRTIQAHAKLRGGADAGSEVSGAENGGVAGVGAVSSGSVDGGAAAANYKVGVENAGNAAGELEKLYAALYSNTRGLQALSSLYLGEAHGSHCAHNLSVALIQKLMQHGARPKDIVFLQEDASKLDNKFFEALVAAEIPFAVSYSVPLYKTQFGAAYITLVMLRIYLQAAALGEEIHFGANELYEDMVSFTSSAYSGISQTQARILQKKWRMKGKASFEERLEDIKQFSNLFDMSMSFADCARTMFENASISKRATSNSAASNQAASNSAASNKVASNKEPNSALNCATSCEDVEFFEDIECMLHESLFDDAAAADTILDYVQVCQELDIFDCGEILEHLDVPINRSFGNLEDAMMICPSNALNFSHANYVVLANMESDAFKMSADVTPFDMLRAKLGILYKQNRPDEQRLKLLSILESTCKCLAAFRVCHNGIGEEICPSALWEELLAPYRSKQDEEQGLSVQNIPSAFKSENCLILVSEAACFAADKNEDAQQALVPVYRGRLSRADSLDVLMPDFKEYGELFSPTALEAMYRCPYRWFINNRIGVKVLDVGFEAFNMGNLAHDTLHAFYQRFQSKGNERVTQDNLKDAVKMAAEVFAECLQEALAKGQFVLSSEADIVQCEKIRDQVLELICRDSVFLPKFKPSYFELKLSGDEENGPLMYAGAAVGGKIDRIDVNAQGEAVIIDYKMSSLGYGKGYGLSTHDKHQPRIQTDIYASMAKQYFKRQGKEIKIIGSVYRSYATNNLRGAYNEKIDWGVAEATKYSDALPNDAIKTTYEEYIKNVEAEVKKCLELLRCGNIAAKPLVDDSCEYCHAKRFCAKEL